MVDADLGGVEALVALVVDGAVAKQNADRVALSGDEEVPTMQAYAAAERPTTPQRLHVADPTLPQPLPRVSAGGGSETVLLDQLLGRLADLVADRLLARNGAHPDAVASEWMDARGAAAYLGVHRDTIRKLAAHRAIPAHQDGPRCKLYFQRDELDAWRRANPLTRSAMASLRAVS